ncbi:MAG: type II secretion system protein [Planctomycetes bacterium]|nr:type II secretion system protein [Planctomycetota bacterium]
MKKMRPKAFTLIELLVVVSILGLLMAILIPSLSGARDQAKSIKCMANLRSFGSGFAAYALENRGYLCSGQADARVNMNLGPEVTDLEHTGIEKIGWIADLVNHRYGFPGQMLCPSNPGRQTQSWGRALALPDGPSHYPPEEFERLTKELGYNTNYCQSWYMIHTQYDGVTTPVFDHDRMHGSIGPLRATMMSKAGDSRVPLLGDARAPRDEVFNHSAQGYGPSVRETKSATDGPGWKKEEDGSYTMVRYTSLTPYGIQDWDDFGPAHRRRRNLRNDELHGFTEGNILFGDGHVAAFQDRFDFDNGRIRERPDGELDSWDLRAKVFDGLLLLGRQSRSVREME